MIDFVAKLISGDGITTILLISAIYVGLLWFLFSFWVYIDAKKRYKKTNIAILFFLVVLIFNFPALVFYLITRPEDEGEFVILPADNLSNRGINVPIVNFVGKDGKVNLSFELKINNPEVLPSNSDMSIDINWKSENPNLEKVDASVVDVKVEEESEKITKKKNNALISKDQIKNKTSESLKNVKNKLGNFKPKFNLPKKEVKKKA